MNLSPALLDWFARAAAVAEKQNRHDFGIPELLLAALADPESLSGVWEGLITGEEHREALLRHFQQSSTAVAAQEAARAAEEEGEFPEDVLEAVEGLEPPPDEALLSVLSSWQRERGDEELDADPLLQLLLYNWNQLYPLPLEKLGIQLQRSGEGAAEFLRAMFAQEADLNQRFGREPMAGLLPYAEYLRGAMEVLVRRYRQNLLIYGLPGVGKSMVLRRLVEETAAGRVPRLFQGKRFFEFNREVFLKDVQNTQDLQARFDILRRHLESHPEIILVVDGIQHWFAGANAVAQDFLQRLLGLLRYKRLHFVLLADVDFHNRVYKANPVFEEWIAPLYVKPLSRGDVLQILEQVKDKFEEQYGLSLAQGQLEQLVEMADQHVKTSQFPKKAMILLDVALSILALDEAPEPPSWETVLRRALGRVTGRESADFPDLGERLSRLEELLRERIIGQEPAIQEVCRTIRFTMSDLDLNPERPDGVFLFAGPAGVGKKLFAHELSRILYNREPFEIDLSDFQEAESLQLITGRFQPGEGYPTASVLERLRSEPRRVVVLKNIEYAAGEVLHYFLKGFEDGFLRDAAGQQLPMGESTVVLLSDLLAYEPRGAMGFSSPEERRLTEESLRDYFMPELLRGVDKLVVFQPLGEEDLRRILNERIVPAFRQKVARLGHNLDVSPDVSGWLARQGSRLEVSARNVDRKFEELVAERVNEAILAAAGRALSIQVRMAGDSVELSSTPVA
jgi:ATP-dependent Clp protease ATP-binding subunit ClpA